MAKSRRPIEKQLQEDSRLASIAFSRRSGHPVEVVLEPFMYPPHITKSGVYCANLKNVGGESVPTTNLPSRVTVKRYFSDMIGMTDREDMSVLEYRRERAALMQDIQLEGFGRVFPELYSDQLTEEESRLVIIREFLPGENLDELVERLKKEGKISWGPSISCASISDPLPSIALTHTISPKTAEIFDEKGLLGIDKPHLVNPDLISDMMEGRFEKYIRIPVELSGKRLEASILSQWKQAFRHFYPKYVAFVEKAKGGGRVFDHITMVNGDLDTFPHHTIGKRLPDAGSIEVGGFVRDLAVWGAPCLREYWQVPTNMARKIVPDYLALRAEYTKRLKYDDIHVNQEIAEIGTIFASWLGCLREGAAVGYYEYGNKDYPVQEKMRSNYATSLWHLDEFARITNDKRARDMAEWQRMYGLDETFTLRNGNGKK